MGDSSTLSLGMLARKIFFILFELLGVNFSTKVSLKTFAILILHSVIIVHTLYVFVKPRLSSHKKCSVFTIISYSQDEVFVLLHFFILVRSFLKRKCQRGISAKVYLAIKVTESNIEVHYLSQLAIIAAIRILITSLMPSYRRMGSIGMIVTALVAASNDFMFAYFVSSLSSNLRRLKLEHLERSDCSPKKIIYDAIFQNLERKRDLHNRYSIELFISIFYHFTQLIIDLYYMCMRVAFATFAVPLRKKKSKIILLKTL